jgi:hypothetical protein
VNIWYLAALAFSRNLQLFIIHFHNFHNVNTLLTLQNFVYFVFIFFHCNKSVQKCYLFLFKILNTKLTFWGGTEQNKIQQSRVRPLSFTWTASSTHLRFVDEQAICVNENFAFLTLTENNYSNNLIIQVIKKINYICIKCFVRVYFFLLKFLDIFLCQIWNRSCPHLQELNCGIFLC